MDVFFIIRFIVDVDEDSSLLVRLERYEGVDQNGHVRKGLCASSSRRRLLNVSTL